MSYILDALRRADAERERGAVPSLHAQQYASLPSDDEPRRGPKPLVWVVIGLSAALVAALAWNFFGRETPPPVVAARAPESVPAPAAAISPPAAPIATPPAAAGPASAAVATAPAEAPKPVKKPVRKPPPPATTPGALPDSSRAPSSGTGGTLSRSEMASLARGNDTPPRGNDALPRANDGAGPARNADPAAAPRPAEGGGDARIYALRDLPEEIRRTLPNVAISGSTYSNDRASRMLMINGQIFHEGDVVSNGLVLQQIKPRGAVFSFKGFRYESGF
ncbi:MAG: general secretion pathway protein GspB [Caldimonas sp.]